MKNLKRLLVAVSGGRSSGMLAHHILTSRKYQEFDKVFVFYNTGQEREETLLFLEAMKKHWGLPLIYLEGVYSLEKWKGVNYKIVNFEDLDRSSKVFRMAIAENQKHKRRGVPHQGQPYCSSYLKVRVSKAFAKRYFKYENYFTALGMRLEDMPKRVTWEQVNNVYDEKLYPLLSDFKVPINQKLVLKFWQDQPFDLAIDSNIGNCELCWKKSDKSLIRSLRAGVRPETLKFYRDMEKRYSNKFFRGNRSINDILALNNSAGCVDDLSDVGDNCFCS